jgi:hypothetical protein
MTIEHPLKIFRNQVKLDVDQVIYARGVEIRSCFGMRDNPNHKALREDLCDGKADSVDSDRTLGGDVMCEFRGQFNLKSIIRAAFFQRHNTGSAIHVALHKMAAEGPIGREGALEIDRASLAERLQVCPLESFLKQIKRNMFPVMAYDRKATTID